MEQKQLAMPNGILFYEEYPNRITVTGYEGMDLKIQIPESIQDKPVTILGKKAFLSNKRVEKVILPLSLNEIGDWAFAYCDALKTVEIPRKRMHIGKDIVLNNKHLQNIRIYEENSKIPDYLAYMIALAMTSLQAGNLLTPLEVGNDSWMLQWDERLMYIMQLDDFDGYADLWICGEEDYAGKDYDEISYPGKKRMNKVRLAFFRLLHDEKLSDHAREFLTAYLTDHAKGKESSETWDVMKTEKYDDLDCFRIFSQAGCITEKNVDAMIRELKEDQIQLRAGLMKYKDEHIGYEDSFDDFSL